MATTSKDAQLRSSAAAVKAESGGGGDVVEASGLCRQIVGSVAGSEVVVVGTAVEREVSRGRGLAASGVVGKFVGAQDVGAVVNFRVAMQFVDIADFFLLVGADSRRVGVLGCGLFRARRAR